MKTITTLFILCFTLCTIAQNNSLQFDGSDDYVDLENAFAFDRDDPFTAEAWIKFSENGVKQIISKLGVENGVFRGWGLQTNNAGYVSGYVCEAFGSSMRFVRGTNFVFDDVWHHVAMTFDGADTILLYLDGSSEPIGFQDNPGTMTDIQTSSPAHIGNYHGGGNQGEYWKGNIDEIRIWDRVLTEAEILANYMTELTGNEPGLLGYYKMDDELNTCDVVDCSPNEFHGVRAGDSGTNDTPQFSTDVPVITDVECGVTLMCEMLNVEESENNTLQISPNPTTGVVRLSGVEFTNSVAVIYNVLGKKIASYLIQNSEINLGSLSTGIYFIKVRVNNQALVKKLVKL